MTLRPNLLLGFIEQRWAASTPETRIVEVMMGYLDYAFSQPRVFDYVFSRPRMDARRFPSDFEERRSPTLNRVAGAVEATRDELCLKPCVCSDGILVQITDCPRRTAVTVTGVVEDN